MKVALIGAGPRGLLILERLLAWQGATDLVPLEVTLYDPYPIGGRVWQLDQPISLIMNTAAQMITLFYDQSVDEPAPAQPGPDLAQWARGDAGAFLAALPDQPNKAALVAETKRLGPNDYPTRAFYGAYLQWVFQELQRRAGHNATVTFTQTAVSAVRKNSHRYDVTTVDSTTQFDAVVMALGNNANTLTRDQQQLQAFAEANHELYLPPNWPAEHDLSGITKDDVVILRGLGLSFFDFMSRLTEGRGGKFVTHKDGHLTYRPSGTEPTIVAGSRRGFPYHAKGHNQKAAGEEVQPHFLTTQQLSEWATSGPIPGEVFWQALQHEVEFVYYSKLLTANYPELPLAAFQEDFLQAPTATLAKLKIQDSDRLDWPSLIDPLAGHDPADYQTVLHQYLVNDIRDAELGTQTGPMTSALEVLRDLRDPIRQVVAQGLLSDDQYLDFFLRWFNGLNDFLSIGPPVIRIKQLLALIDAGVVTLLPPGMKVTGERGKFMASSTVAPTVVYQGTVLIEARVPAANAPTAENPLLQQLLHDDMATLYELQLAIEKRFQSGAILVDRASQQLLNEHHDTQGDLYFWGVPTEGFHWLTTASPRPYVNDISLRQANTIASRIWSHAELNQE